MRFGKKFQSPLWLVKEKTLDLLKMNTFLNLSEVAATRATCPRLHVGTMLVKDGMVISSGYNGAPKGLKHCDDVGCKIVNGHCVRVVHSELNSLLQAAHNGVSTKDASLYTKYLPCEACAKVIINAGIARVVFRDIYKNIDQPYTRKLFREAKIKLTKLRGKRK